MWGMEHVIVLSSEAIKEVLVTKAYSCFPRQSISRARNRAIVGNGLLAVDDDVEHKIHKRNLLPAFAFRHVRELFPIFWTKASELVERLDRVVEPSKNIDLRPRTLRAALDVIGVAAWGNDFNTLANPTSDLLPQYSQLFQGSPRANTQAKIMYGLGLLVLMHKLAHLFPCEFFTNVAQGKRALRQACFEAIELKRKGLKNKLHSRHDILNVALASEEFGDDALVDHMLTILIAGHETSGLAATWACYLLCKHPEIQTRLRARIRSNLPPPLALEKSSQQHVRADVL